MNFSRSLLLSCAVLTLSACGSVLFNPPKNTVAQVIPPKTFKVDPALLGSPMQNYYANNQAQTVPLGQPIPA
ncbi:MAG: hypothetical protein LBL69_00630, partial [Zoogloeaceae bacterium]|nr:hypothetical protein [Zoogloeaceae bacterium]